VSNVCQTQSVAVIKMVCWTNFEEKGIKERKLVCYVAENQ